MSGNCRYVSGDDCQGGLHDLQGEAEGSEPCVVESKLIAVCNYLKGSYKDACLGSDRRCNKTKTCFQLERFTLNIMKNYSTG